MTRAGLPIEEHPVKNSVDPGINYAPAFGELEACVAAGLNPWTWESGGYSVPFKARIVAWFQLHQTVQLHVQDAVQRKMEKKKR